MIRVFKEMEGERTHLKWQKNEDWTGPKEPLPKAIVVEAINKINRNKCNMETAKDDPK